MAPYTRAPDGIEWAPTRAATTPNPLASPSLGTSQVTLVVGELLLLDWGVSDERPGLPMLQALRRLLECGVAMGELHEHYRLFGARQVTATVSPGSRLYAELKMWPHFTLDPLSS